MVRTGLARIFLVGAVALGLSGAASAAPARLGFQAFLLNGTTGKLSPDVLASGTQLGNVIIGEYSSTSTFVVVKVALGAKAMLPRQARVRLVATVAGGKPGRPLLDSTTRLGTIGEDGNAYVGFWLADTGCKPVALTATLIGASAPASSKSSLDFACYG